MQSGWITPWVYSYQSCKDLHTALRLRMKELALMRMRYGYRKIGTLLRREGFRYSMGMLHRVYREEGLSLRYRPGRRSKSQVTRTQRRTVFRPNQARSLDFVADQLSNGSRFRCLTLWMCLPVNAWQLQWIRGSQAQTW